MDTILCEPCKTQNIIGDAVIWCINCDEALCMECSENHRAMKMLRSHKVIDISSRPTKIDVFIQVCSKHNDMNFEYYCVYHDEICCKECFIASHRSCSKVMTIVEASKGITKSQVITDLAEKSQQILETITLFTDKKEENVQSIDKEVEHIQETIREIKTKLINQAEVQERHLIDKLNAKKSEILKKMKQELSKTEEIKTTIAEQKDAIDFFVEHGSDKQVFVFTNAFKSTIKHIQGQMTDYINTSKYICLNFSDNNLLDKIKSLGTISTTEFPSEIELPAHMLLSLKFDSYIDIVPKICPYADDYPSNINGFVFTQKEKLLVSIAEFKKLLIFDKNEKFSVNNEDQYNNDFYDEDNCSVRLQHTPWDAAIIPGTDTVVVTCYSEDIIQVVHTKKREVVEVIEIEGTKQKGVTASTNELFVGGKNQIFILNHQLILLRKLPTQFSPWYICLGRQNNMYCSDAESLYGINLDDGRQTFRYTSEKMSSPRKIITDQNGIVYVIGCWSFNVLRFTPDGTFLDIILEEKDGIHFPTAICFNQDYTKLYVVFNDTAPFISVFKST